MAATAGSPSGGPDAADPSCPASAVQATLQVIQAPARAFLPIKKARQALPPFIVQVLILTLCPGAALLCMLLCWRSALLCQRALLTVQPASLPLPLHQYQAPVSRASTLSPPPRMPTGCVGGSSTIGLALLAAVVLFELICDNCIRRGTAAFPAFLFFPAFLLLL